MILKPTCIAAALVLVAAAAFAQTQPAQQSATLQGEVLEIKNVDAYTYLRLKTKDGETWAAVNKTPVKKGQRVEISNPMVMQNFESKTLKKTFDRIVFGSLGGPNAQVGSGTAKAHGGQAAAPVKAIAKVAKASGPDAKTVDEVILGKAALKDKTVVLRGQAVKVTSGVMGKNWVHVQDGSGTAAAGTHDILITTTDNVAVGDIITAKGTVRTDVNLGSGYAFEVLIENVSIQK